MAIERPLPDPNALTAAYWQAAREHKLVLPRCDACNRYHFYPRAVCPHCRSTRLSWQPVSGRGEVYSYTVVHRPPSEAFKSQVPYVVAVVQLQEGPHLMTKLVGIDADRARVGMAVEVDFEDVDEQVSLPVFRELAT